MTLPVIVKIDLCKSKLFSKERELEFPDVRKVLTEKLKKIAEENFPFSQKKYPEGSFYKVEGDAVYFILEKPTVAIRSSIEFMKAWYYYGLKEEFPECKILIHRGKIDKIDVPEGTDFVGEVFEHISVIEKTLDEGKIYVTQGVKENADATISKFVSYGVRKVSTNENINLFYVAFSDPRTFENDALAHLLFVAHEGAKETRNKIFCFFLIEYLIENGELSDLSKFEKWSRSKGYSTLPQKEITQLLSSENLFEKERIQDVTIYRLRGDQLINIKKAREDYEASVKQAVQIVKKEIIKDTRTEKAVEGFDIKEIMEEFLCGVFSEIRMMANYFRDTTHFYESNPKNFEGYDYIIERHLEYLDPSLVNKWKMAFFRGLKIVSQQENIYISAIFHNILAGYYLNRSFHSSPYQLEKLQERVIFLDTNVLYALKCKSSNYYERIQYFSERLKKINVKLRIFPFTLSEYEMSLEGVQMAYEKDPYSSYLLNWNPWLYQEFKSHPHQYLNDIAVCKIRHSIAKDHPIREKNYSIFEEELKKINVCLEHNYDKYSEEEKKEIWDNLRSIILSKTGDMEDYWSISYKLSGHQESIIEHDVNLMENVQQFYIKSGNDSLGPKVLLLTLDSKLLKCKEIYPFLITTEQFLEFMLPYLFLADIPAEEPNRFPNMILSAQIGIHTSYWKPNTNDYVRMVLENPEVLEERGGLGLDAKTISKALSTKRFKNIIRKRKALNESEKKEVALQVSEAVDEMISSNTEMQLLERKIKKLKIELEREKQEKEKYSRKAEKLHRTLKYFKKIKPNRNQRR